MIYIFFTALFSWRKGGTLTIPAPPIYESRQEASHRICGSFCIASLGGPPIGGQENDRVSYLCSTPYTLLPPRGISPQGETRDMERKTASHILHVPFRRFPPLVAGATTFPPLRGGHYRCLAMGPCLCRKAWSSLFCPPDGVAREHESHQRTYFALCELDL